MSELEGFKYCPLCSVTCYCPDYNVCETCVLYLEKIEEEGDADDS